MKNKLTLTTLTALAGFAGAVSGQITISNANTSFSEDFNNLGSDDGTGYSWTNDNATRGTGGMPGWYWQSDGGDQPYEAEDGSSNSGSPFAFGDDADSDRAIGNLGGGDNDNTAWGVVFLNDTGADLTSFDVSFTGEQWRAAGDEAETTFFSYQVSTTDITDFDETGGAAPAGWTSVSALDFESPQATNVGQLDGNLAANQESLSNSIAATVGAGEYVAFRWYDADDGGTDNGMAIDDFSVSAVPEPGTFALFAGLMGLVYVMVKRRRA